MQFTLLDRIIELKPGVRATAIKTLSLAEEYLADHFPLFPVMPGVLMLESMTQCGAWLVRLGEDFSHSMVVLQEARNVKFANFVAPGQTLTVTTEVISHNATETKLKAQGTVDGVVNVSGRLVLARYNLADRNLGSPATDRYIRHEMRKQFLVLYRAADAAPEQVERFGAAGSQEGGGEAKSISEPSRIVAESTRPRS